MEVRQNLREARLFLPGFVPRITATTPVTSFPPTYSYTSFKEKRQGLSLFSLEFYINKDQAPVLHGFLWRISVPIFALSAICSGLINIVISRAPEKKVLRIQKCSNRQCCIFVIDRCAVLSDFKKLKILLISA